MFSKAFMMAIICILTVGYSSARAGATVEFKRYTLLNAKRGGGLCEVNLYANGVTVSLNGEAYNVEGTVQQSLGRLIISDPPDYAGDWQAEINFSGNSIYSLAITHDSVGDDLHNITIEILKNLHVQPAAAAGPSRTADVVCVGKQALD